MRKKHHAYFLLQLAVLIFGVTLVIHFSPNRDLQFLCVAIMSAVYAVLGIIHHWINHDLVFKIVLEYIFIAALGASVIFFIYKGGFGF